ncbi:hypothetical protein acsn021_43720 [Anaerocolumna cellulosilytica]|uniref:Uncharacterized protein n=1 Tax=Anaerocolumna cellulosilytica TaxID=433286 RepID=A0A6S6R050_9FIRM|nr:hypothetical protein [Anaerocolumna cellulosilytica]MBB5195329.1 hypothetical protein [Anaerocolumna cellulosilytica]BCJ96803.1 hypothetical protein acsn021_43720 [Anaerocolumna cellulosilytica]
MKKSDAIKIISKTVFAGAVAIGLCSVAFTGFNNKVIASEMKKQTSSPTTYNIKTIKIEPSEDYVKEDYKVIINRLSPAKDINSLSAEAAAEIGAKYIWNMYKASLKEKVVVMYYNVSPITSETRWIGDVYENYDQTQTPGALGEPDYSFMINSISGERQSIQMKHSPSKISKPIPFDEKKANAYYKENCEEYKELAMKFTKESYGVKVASTDFDSVSALLENVRPRPENLEAIRLYINFIVVDTEGTEYSVSITEDTKELQSINSIEPDGGSDYLG